MKRTTYAFAVVSAVFLIACGSKKSSDTEKKPDPSGTPVPSPAANPSPAGPAVIPNPSPVPGEAGNRIVLDKEALDGEYILTFGLNKFVSNLLAATLRDPYKDCIKSKLDVINIQSGKDFWEHNANVDTSECELIKISFDKDIDFDTVKKNVEIKSSVKRYYKEVCPAFDFTKFNEKPRNEFLKARAAEGYKVTKCNGGSYVLTTTTERSIDATKSENEALKVLLKSQETIVETSQSIDAKPCLYQFESELQTVNCEESVTKTLDTNGKKTVSHFKVKKIDLKSDSNSFWYLGGKIEAEIENWNGVLNYTADGAAPTYKFTSGLETLEGSLGEPRVR